MTRRQFGRIDSRRVLPHPGAVLTLLRHFLCLVLAFGLVGNGAALAAPCNLMPASQSAAMAGMPDCAMGMMKSDPAPKHKDDGKPGCIMMVGCTPTLTMKEPFASSSMLHASAPTGFWPVTPVYSGRDIAPELDPPTRLG